MLYLVGLGLNDEKDITVNGLEVVKRAERVYLEAYTAILMVDKERLVRPPLPPTPQVPSHTSPSLTRHSRKPSTAGLSSSPIEKWSSPPPTKSSLAQ